MTNEDEENLNEYVAALEYAGLFEKFREDLVEIIVNGVNTKHPKDADEVMTYLLK